MVAAALVAKKAVEKGLTRKPWVKTTLAPGSKVVTDYFDKAGLTPYLDKLGFNLVGYGCTTCIGNSGPLPEEVSKAVNDARPRRRLGALRQPQLRGPDQPRRQDELPGVPAAGRRVRLAGSMKVDITKDAAGPRTSDGKPVFLEDIWPSEAEVNDVVALAIGEDMFTDAYADVFAGDEQWQALPTPDRQHLRVGPASPPTCASPRTSRA